jgi:hypothetical protein
MECQLLPLRFALRVLQTSVAPNAMILSEVSFPSYLIYTSAWSVTGW